MSTSAKQANTTRKSMKSVPIWIYFGQVNLHAWSAKYRYNTNRETWTRGELYKS